MYRPFLPERFVYIGSSNIRACGIPYVMEAKRQAVSQQALCERIVQKVADAEGVDPMALQPRLYDVIDPESLERLFKDSQRARASDLSVQFEYNGLIVQIDADGDISLEERTH